MAETFNVTQVTNLSGLDDGDGIVDPGEVVTTTVTITNQSTTTNATGVSFAEVLQGMTLVNQFNDANPANDINVSPLAFDDSYNSVGNTTLTVSAENGVLGGAVANVHETFAADTEFLSQSIGGGANQTHVVAGTFATTQGGSVTILADGSFTYTPKVGFEGTGASADTFTYTLRDAGLDGIANNADDLTGTGTVSIDVGPVIWYIDNSAATNGNGTKDSPFNSIAAFNAVNNGVGSNPAAGDIVYLATGTGTYTESDGVNLLNGQTFIGAGEALTITPTGGGNAVTIFAAGTAPVINVTGTGEGVSLAENNTLKGFAINTNDGTDGIEDGGGTVGSLTISNVSISGTGSAIDIDEGGTLTVSLNSISSTGADIAIDLDGVGGTFGVTGTTTINDATVDGIAIGNSSVNATFGGKVTVLNDAVPATGDGIELGSGAGGANTGTYSFNGGVDITVNGANAFGLRAQSSGTVNITDVGTTQIVSNNGSAIRVNPTTLNATIDQVTSTGGLEGISLNGMSGSLTIGSVDIDGQTGDGIDITSSAGAVTINGGTIGASDDPTGIGVDINGGSGNVTIGASVNKTTVGHIVEVTARTGGTITFTGAMSATSGFDNGIDIDANTGGIINFNNQINLSTGANTAVDLTGNTNATVNFNSTGNGLDIATTTGVGFNATGGGTVTVTGTGNTISSGTSTALNIVNTTIGANDVTFQSISANGGSATGIILDNTGSAGGLHVTGTSVAGSGGTIAEKTGADGSTTSGIGIYLNNTSDVQLNWMNLHDFDNYAIRGLGVSGFTLNNSVVNALTGTNGTSAALNEGSISFGVFNGTTGLTGTASVSNTTIEDGVEGNFRLFNTTGSVTLTMDNISVSGSGDDGVQTQNFGNATVNIEVKNSDFSANRGDHFNAAADGNANLNVQFGNNGANTLAGGLAGALGEGIAIQTGVAWNGSGSANISNNSINNAVDTPININIGGTGTFTAIVNNNTIGTSGVADSGTTGNKDAIRIIANGDAGVDATPNGGTLTASITNNTIQQVSGRGIFALARDGGTAGDPIELNLTIQGNTLRQSPNSGSNGIRIEAGATSEDDVRVHANIGGAGSLANLFPDDWAVTGAGGINYSDIRILHAFSDTSQFILTGLGANTSNSSTVATYLTNRNSFSGGGLVTASIAGGGVFETGGTPPLPLLAAAGGAPMAQPQGPLWQLAGIGDFDGDGSNDALLVSDNGLLQIDTVVSDQVTASHALGQLEAGWQIVGTSDIDGDGTSDILLRHEDGGYQAELIQNNAVVATIDLEEADDEPPAGDDPIPTNDTPPADSDTDPSDIPTSGEPPAPPIVPVAPAHPVILDDGVLTQAELDYFVDAAITRWASAGLSAEQLAALHDMQFTVADMSGLYLGSFSPDAITIDADAAGWGWFLDGTPLEDSEFGTQLGATRMTTDPTSAPAGHYDLLTTLMHEMGHVLGLEDSYDAADLSDLMYGWLQLGERRLPAAGVADFAVTGSIQTEEFLGSPINIGVLPHGKSVTIQWQATVDDQEDQLIVNPVNQGTVTASNAVGFPDTTSNIVITGLDTLVLGGTVWNDNGAGGGISANGLRDGTEAGVSGVLLSLFTDDNDNGVWDAGDQAVLQLNGITPLTATTDAGGNYSFAGLAPGDYIVRVDQDNFDAGGNTSLVPLQVSSPGDPDPDDGNPDVDNDDNGARVPGEAAYSRTITLDYNTEPSAGPGNDTNNTLDFGFFANIPPTASATSGSGSEDQPARIAITLTGNDADSGDAVQNFIIQTLAANGQLFDAASGGNLLAVSSTVPATGPVSGPWTATVYFQPNADWSGATNFTYSAFDGDQSGAAATASITVAATGDVSVTAGDVSGAETDATVTVPLSLSVTIGDGDGSETLSNVVVAFTGAPAGMTASVGSLFDNGLGNYTLTLTPAQLATASVTVPADYAGSFTAAVVATTNEGDSVGTSVDDQFTVTVGATAEPITGGDVSGSETDAAVAIPLALSVHVDADGSETLSDVVVTFTGAPAGLLASAGSLVDNTGGSYTLTLTPAEYATVSITVPADYSGSFTGSAVANSNEGASPADAFTVTVTATGDVSVTANDVGGAETDAAVTIALSLSSLIDDIDGSETLTDIVVTFSGEPVGMTATGGTLVGNVLTIPAANVATASITVPADYAGTFSASAVANTNEGSSVSDSFDVTVSATAQPITANDVGGAETDAAVTIALALSVHADADGSETLTDVVVTFTGAPAGLLASAGVLVDNGSGSYTLTLTPAQYATVSITVPADYSGSFSGSAVANSDEGSSPADAFTVTVAATGDVSVTADDVGGAETDAAVTIALSLSTLVDDVDASETLTDVVVTFTGAPAGMTATGGTLVGNVLTIAAANVATASITLPANYAGSISASAVANTNEGSSTADGFTVTVTSEGDVSLVAGDVSGTETDAAVIIPLSLSAPITDADASETLSDVVVTFTGAPSGMTATGGTLVGNVLTIPGANVGTASITVPADYSGSFTASAVAHSSEGTSNTDGFTVTVAATGDVSVTANDVSGTETDAAVTIALSLSTLVDDIDASETLTDVVVTFTGAPAGMTAATGALVDNGLGSYTLTLTPAEVAGASITVPADYAGSISGSAVANSNEGSSAADGFTVTVAPAEGDVSLTAGDVSGTETDAAVTIALSLSAPISDPDGSETLSDVVVTFTGAPSGMTATGGTLVGNVLTIPGANVGTASITVPADYSGSFTASAVANSNEGSSAADGFTVTVAATGDVSVTANDVGGTETDAAVTIALSLSTLVDDADASETLTNVVVTFTGAPSGMTAATGALVDNGGGSYTLTLTPAEVAGASITVPADYFGDITGSAVANSTEGASPADGFTVHVADINDAPVAADDTLAGVNEDSAPLTISFASLTGNDDKGAPFETSQALTITNVSGAVGGSVQIVGTDVVFTPTANFHGAASFDYTVSDNGTTNGGPDPLTDQGHVTFTIAPVADAPSVTGATVNEDGQTTSGMVISRNAADGPEVTHFKITNIQHGTLFHNDGVTHINDGDFISFVDANAGLKFIPDANYNGPASFDTQASLSNGDGGLGGGVATAIINVVSINDEPSGTSSTITAFEDTARVLRAADFGFSDTADGDTLAAVRITTLPGAGTLKNNGVAVTAGQTISIADINAGRLTFQAALNANGAAYAQFSFQVQDNGGTLNGGVNLDQTPNTLTVNVNAVNDAPSAVILSNVHGPFPENTSTAARIKVADIAVADVDGGANTLSLSGADASLFQIIGSTLWLKAGAKLDYETNPLLNVNVNVNDPNVGGPVDATKALAIRVTDIAENITGTPRNDRLVGTNNGETINGFAGNDTIYGLGGNDRIIGGLGADRLTGGLGRDVFVFNSISDSAPGQSGYINNGTLNWLSGHGRRDVITDFTHGQDRIDLSAIDANSRVGGNQAFTFDGHGRLDDHHPGELAYRQFNFSGTANDKTIIYGDVNGDARADFQIELTGLKVLAASDFVL